uniref:J domain-containing protein n=1 Tax=Meloidogyne incognita TaxID=6306 RepID=A0A914KX29_MELIC
MNCFLFPLLLLTFFKLFQPVELTNYYETLNVDSFATKEEIETAYHNLINEMVNDNGLDAQSKEIKLKDLKEAFKVLSDETSRARYDYYLGIPRKKTGIDGVGSKYPKKSRSQ